MTTTPALGTPGHRTTALPAAGPAASLISGTLTANFNGNISAITSVKDASRVNLLVSHTPHAAEAGGVVNLLVLFAYTDAAPTLGDDVWYPPSIETAGSAGALPGTLPTGADYGANPPNWTPYAVTPKYYTLAPADGGEALRVTIPIDCPGARWMYVAAIQQVDTTNFGTIAISAALSA